MQANLHATFIKKTKTYPISYSIIPGFSKKTAIPWSTTPQRFPPVPQFNVVFWILCLAAFKKKQPFLLMMLGTSDHNIEVGGCGGKQGISVVSCGWLFFFKNPVTHHVISLHWGFRRSTMEHLQYPPNTGAFHQLSGLVYPLRSTACKRSQRCLDHRERLAGCYWLVNGHLKEHPRQ